MRVLVNAVSANVGGGATYAVEQLGALADQPGVELVVYAAEPTAGRLRAGASHARIVAVPRRPLALRLLWEQSVLAWRSRRYDVLYGIGNFASLPALAPQVVTFQNPNHFGAAARRVNRRFGSRAHRVRIWAERVLARTSVRRAAESIAISESLRDSMLEDLPRSGPRLVLSATPIGDPSAEPPERIESLPSHYVLSVANDYPHKDWDGLARAFAEAPDLPPLVLVGAPRPSRRANPGAGTPGRVVVWGPESDGRRLDAMYRNADAYIAHSHLEAFSLTPLEALSRGIPVIASDIPSHREVSGAQAEYYDPDDPADLAAVLRRALRSSPPEPQIGRREWGDNAAELAAILRSVARA